MRIETFSFGSMTVDGRVYGSDVLLLPPRILSPWWRQKGHSLEIKDLSEVLDYRPAILVVGTGVSEMMIVPASVAADLESAGIRLETYGTLKACERFNELFEKWEKVAGAFHLTC